MGFLNKRRRLLIRWTVVSGVILVLAILWSLAGQSNREEAVLPGAQVEGLTSILARDISSETILIHLENVTKELGIDFRHFPAKRESLLPEDMGSGVAVGDFDGDGYPDLFFVNFVGSIIPDAPEVPANQGFSKLYRNIDGEHFEDVTEKSGIHHRVFGMGAAWGDYDNDGDLDLYITAYGPNVLYENLGDGSFQDVTEKAGVQDTRFSTGCAWGDYDRDGDLDLYVVNYVDFVFRQRDRKNKARQYATEQPYTLNPSAYKSQPNSLFQNNGDGTFTEVAQSAGIDDPKGRSLSASWVDFDNDGLLDLYVANDVSNNGVFQNRGDGTFEDIGAPSLAADYRGAMGIAISDFDNDLDLDLFITHWIAQENALYRNMIRDDLLGESENNRTWFMDEAEHYGLGQSSLDMVGWATGFCDFDNDTRRDLWIVNGSTLENTDHHELLTPQSPLILWNRNDEGFVNIAEHALGESAKPVVGRGGAQFDFNQDGLVDLVFVIRGGEAIVLKNVSSPTGHYLRVKLRQRNANTSAIGARVYVTAGGITQMDTVGTGSSYLSQHELTLHFGLGDAQTIDTLRIVWPDGEEETYHDLPVDQTFTYFHN